MRNVGPLFSRGATGPCSLLPPEGGWRRAVAEPAGKGCGRSAGAAVVKNPGLADRDFVETAAGGHIPVGLSYRWNRQRLTSRHPSSRSCTARRFLPASCSSPSVIQPSAHATRISVRPSLSIVPHGSPCCAGSNETEKILTVEGVASPSRNISVQAAG